MLTESIPILNGAGEESILSVVLGAEKDGQLLAVTSALARWCWRQVAVHVDCAIPYLPEKTESGSLSTG